MKGFGITECGAVVLSYEVFAKATGRRTWTGHAADHSWRSFPVWVFLVWLLIHLLRAVLSGHD